MHTTQMKNKLEFWGIRDNVALQMQSIKMCDEKYDAILND